MFLIINFFCVKDYFFSKFCYISLIADVIKVLINNRSSAVVIV